MGVILTGSQKSLGFLFYLSWAGGGVRFVMAITRSKEKGTSKHGVVLGFGFGRSDWHWICYGITRSKEKGASKPVECQVLVLDVPIGSGFASIYPNNGPESPLKRAKETTVCPFLGKIWDFYPPPRRTRF